MALGHPKGLFPLFFTEMWERLAFYTMLAILVLYTTDLERGGLGLPAGEGNEIYGLYLAFVYFTPFIGGMIADRFIGYRKAVVIGGVCMSTGLFLMSVPGYSTFVSGLALLVIGNGFFKPNISVMVGNLYEPGDPKRDAGFNIFYMGINIGAFAAGVLAATVRNELGWLWTFRVAGIGLLVGITILILSWKSLESADRQPEKNPDDTPFSVIIYKILGPAFVVGLAGYFLATAYLPEGFGMRPAVCGFLAGMIPVIVFFVRLGLNASEEERPGLLALLPVYLAGGTFFMILHLNGSAMTQWARDNTDRQVSALPAAIQQEALPRYYLNAGEEVARPNRDTLLAVDETKIARMYGQQRMDAAMVARLAAIEGIEVKELSLDGSASGAEEAWQRRASMVYEDGVVKVREGTDSHGAPTVTVEVPDGAKPIRRVAFLRQVEGKPIATFVVDKATVAGLYDSYQEKYGKAPQTLEPGEFLQVVNPEVYQNFNPVFVVFLTPIVVWFFGFMLRRKRGITTARKIFYGLALTTLSLLVMAVAGLLSDNGSVKVSGLWLGGFYFIVTLGELCLSPMGLSLVTKLTPKRLVGLTMGGWFLATAFGNNFSGFFGGIQSRMTPVSFFLLLAFLAACISAFIYMLLPRLDATIKKYGA
jgi:dipeptide/tripeptide permease